MLLKFLVHNCAHAQKPKIQQYSLKQTAILSYKQLKDNLATFGYHPIPYSVDMWKHKARKTLFCLCVDDFDIQYHSRADTDHLINALNSFYNITIDWTGRQDCGLQMEWNYKSGFVNKIGRAHV